MQPYGGGSTVWYNTGTSTSIGYGYPYTPLVTNRLVHAPDNIQWKSEGKVDKKCLPFYEELRIETDEWLKNALSV